MAVNMVSGRHGKLYTVSADKAHDNNMLYFVGDIGG